MARGSGLKRWLRPVGILRPSYVRMAADLSSLRRFRELQRVGTQEGGGKPVELRLRPLGGRGVAVRPGTSDVGVLAAAFARGRHHEPPRALKRDEARRIWDLGANIGLTMAHFAELFPMAEILGVELDRANAALCRRNTAPWGSRCELLEAAVWTSDGEVAYAGEPGEGWGVHVVSGGTGTATAPAVSLNTLLERLEPGAMIDYAKMDIEGAEREVLTQNTEWASRVRFMKVEVHLPYTPEECAADVEKLGFKTEISPRPAAGMVIATQGV